MVIAECRKAETFYFFTKQKAAGCMSHVSSNFYFAVKFLFGVHPQALDRDSLFILSRPQEGPKQSKSQAVRSQA
jgi:hypothetical protein